MIQECEKVLMSIHQAGRPPKGAVNRGRRKRPFGVLAEGAQWGDKGPDNEL